MQMARCPSIQISTMYGYKRQLLWGTVTTVCVSVTLIDYLWKSNHPFITRSSDSEGVPATGTNDYQIPTLVQLNASYYCKCDCTGNHDIPEVTATENISCKPTDDAPCQPDGLVLMSMLQKSVNFEQYQGLRYLDHLSLSRYYSCKPSSVPLLPNHTVEKQCKNVTFVNHQSSLVALVSFHGSGNTWVRHLVEQATGIFTGSIYCDPGLKSVFPGESIVSGNVIVIKTHRSDSVELPDDVKLFTQKTSYDKAIVIVRNPYDALVSEANRRWNSKHSINNHLGVADKTTFISNSKWDWFVEYKGATWAFLLHTWLARRKMPVLVVQYEALVKQTEKELTQILKFLNFPAKSDVVKCAVENGKGKFKRLEHLDFNPFSAENYEAVNRYIIQATPILEEYGIKYDIK